MFESLVPLILTSFLLVGYGKCQEINLLTSYDQFVVAGPNPQLKYIDSYFNNCISKIDFCSRGMTGSINLTILYSQNNAKTDASFNYGRLVLYSSGGDSPHSRGGVYLHQVNTRGDNFLEFGLTYYDNLFTTRIYVNDLSPVRIGYMWDKQTVKVFVDGILYDHIQTPIKRSFMDLNFNPFKAYKFLKPASTQTTVGNILFIEGSSDSQLSIARGEESSYTLGCYKFINQPVDGVTVADSSKPLFIQCKEICASSSKKYAALSESNCACIESYEKFKELLAPIDCWEQSVYSLYISSSIRTNQPSTTLDLNIERVLLRTPVEIGDPVGIQVKGSTDQNYVLKVDFGSGRTKSMIGDNFMFDEFYDTGTKSVNITAYSLSDRKRVYSKVIQFSINSKSDREPMNSVSIRVDLNGEKSVSVTVQAAGGSPFTCHLNMGDSSPKIVLESTSRIQAFNRNYTYQHTGIYNVTVNCSNTNSGSNDVTKSILVYLPDQISTNFYSVFDNSYFTKTFDQIVISRPTSPTAQIDLELPFVASTQHLKFQIIDPFDKNTKIEYINTIIPKDNKRLIIKLTADNLKRYNENYFQVFCEDLLLASYVVILEDSIDLTPSLKIRNQVLVENKPVFFELSLNRTSNTLVKIDYGDGQSQIFSLYTSTKPDTKPYVLNLNHTYTTGTNFYLIKITVANHMAKYQLAKELNFETSLPLFTIRGINEIAEVNQTVNFKVSSEPQAEPVKVDLIQIKFDSKNSRVFKDYVFAKNNSFSLDFSFRFTYYGYFDIAVNCSNQISFQISTFRIKIGSDLNTANGVILNNYVNINEPVFFKVNVNGGNGYNINFDFDDGNKMELTWSYITSSGSGIVKDSPVGSVKPNAVFNQSGVYISYQYQLPGVYNPKIQIVNPFKELLITFCSSVDVLSEPKPQSSDNFDPFCFVSIDNIDLYINNSTVKYEQFLKVAKGIPNVFTTGFSLCTNPYLTQLKTRWVLMRLPMGKSIDYEEVIDKYCSVHSENNQLFIDANELEFGNYTLRVYSYREDEPQNFVRHGVYLLKVETSPIKISLNNGQKNVELHLDQSFLLNFYDKTYDPDAKLLSDKTDFQFYFLCVQDYMNRIEFVKEIQTSMLSLRTDLSSWDINLAFYSDELKIWFYEKECFINKPFIGMENNPIKLQDNNLLISGNSLLLNQSLTLGLQLYVQKKTRISVSQQMMITMNMSKLFAISADSDFDEINSQLDKLNDLAKQNPQKALNILTSFADVVNTKATDPVHNGTTTNTTVDANSKFSDIRGKMLNTVGDIVNRVDDGDSILTAAKTVGSVSSNSDQMPLKNQETGSFAIEKMGDKAKSLGNESPELVTEIASSILGATGNTFDAAARTVPTVQENFTDPGLLEPVEEKPPVILPAKITAPLELYECEECDAFPDEVYEEQLIQEEIQFQKEEVDRKKTADVAKRTFNGISGAGLALASTSSNGSNMTKIESKSMSLIVGKKNVNDTDEAETEFGTEGGLSILMPVISSVVNTSNSSLPPSIVTSMIASAENPLQSSKSRTSGMIVSLKLTDDFGNPIVVNNTKEPFNIKIPSSSPAPSFRAYVNRTGINYHKLYLATNSSSLHVVVIPELKGDFYHIYIKYSEKKIAEVLPDEHNYDYVFTSPDLSAYNTDPSNELMYTAFISNNFTKGNGTYYIGVKLAIASNETRSMGNDSNSTEYLSYYKVRIFSTSCKYWKEDTSEWSTDGCYVGPNTAYNMTECLCYHLTTFGTDFYVPPNTIDFSTVFGKFKDLSENAAVFATVVSVIGLYVLVAIYVRYKDKKDLIKWGATPLADNLPTDNYYYLLSVQTGVGKSTGTTSKVGFVLSGDQADSGVRKLSDEKRKAFKSGSICNFIMGVEEPLGSLQYLRIWHDNSGSGDSKSWYLNTVTIVDLQSNQKSNFVCNQWFAVEKGDGQIDRVIPEACQSDLISFKHLFTQSVKKKFTDNHLWFSVFARPTKSSFTRLQRLSCCMSLLFTTMIANAMFYRSEENAKTKSGVMEIGPIKFTMSQLYTSVISSLIVIPVNLINVTLFRKAKLRHNPLIKPRKTGHIAKQQYWRRVKQIESIELPESMDRSSYFNINQELQSQSDFGSRIETRKRKSVFKKLFESNKNFEYKRESKEDVRNKKQGRNLPHWVIYISWFLVFVSILVPAFFVILYSMQWGKTRSEAWLGSLFLSFFQSLFIVDPLKVFLITAVITWILKKPDDDDDTLIDSGDPLYNAIVNHDEEYLHTTTSSLSQIDIREIMESRRSKLTTLKPVDPDTLDRQRVERQNSIKLKEIFREAASYLSFFVIVLFLSYQSRSKNSYYVHKDLSNQLLTNSEMAFEDIVTRDDLWDYIEKVFVPSMYAPVWYNEKKLNWREKLTSMNRYSIRVGAPRIRQLRIKENTCIVNSKMSYFFDHCRDDYNWVDDDTKDYNVGWKPILNGTLTNSSSTTAEAGVRQRKTKWKCKNAWCYQNTLQTKSTPILGKFTSYKGGGYGVSLGRTLERSNKLISDLKNEGWFDEFTRAVFLEFSLYNPNVNLFSSGTLIVEYLSTGAAITYQAISVFSLYSYLGSFGIIVLVFEIIFIIYIIYFIVIEAIKLKKQKCQYFKQFWNLNEFVIITLSIISMSMFAMRTVFTNLAIKAVFESEMGEFVNFNTIALWDEIFNGLSAIVVFCATLKFMKLLRFNKHIGALAATLRYACKDLVGFSCTFGIIFMAFTQFGVLIFGSKNSYYKDFMSSLASTFRFSLGQFNLGELQDASFVLGSVYFIIFILIVIMGLMSMFITILDQAYHKVKEDMASQKNDLEIVDYFFQKIKNIKKPKNKRRGENKEMGDLSASATSLRVNIKQSNDKNGDQLYSASFKSLNVGSSMSHFESHDSMSMY